MKSHFFVFKAQFIATVLGLIFIACIILAVFFNLITSTKSEENTQNTSFDVRLARYMYETDID